MNRYRPDRCVPLLGVLLVCTLLSGNVTAKSPGYRAIIFALCSDNVKNIIVAKQVDGDAYRLVITLNSLGAGQFRQIESQYPGRIINVEWAGVSLGKNRLYINVPADAKQLLLGSAWMSRQNAEGKLRLVEQRLLHMKNPHAPCGLTRGPKTAR